MAFSQTPRRFLIGGALGLFASLALGATALAVPIRGTLQLPRNARPLDSDAERENYYWRVWNGVLEPRPEQLDPRHELAVVLTGATEGDPVGCDYALRGGDLTPATIVVKQGTTLRIENHDGC